jgi:predicted MPP superfamily phosphohydrolase
MYIIKSFKLVLILILTLTPIIAFVLPVSADDTTPRYIHLSWVNNPKTTMTIAWKTNVETASIVQYGLNTAYGDEEIGTDAIWHFVELTGLSPDTVYHFRVGDGNLWSKDSYFKTGTTGKHTTFVGLGDAQEHNPNRKLMVDVVNNVMDLDFFLYSGDFIENAREVHRWNSWFADYSKLTNHLAMMSALGNHEKNHSNYYNFLALPGNEAYYSFSYGSVHFAILHTYWEGVPDENYTDQVDWLTADLDAHQDYEWTFIMMHRPPFSSFPRYFEVEPNWYQVINDSFRPVFEQYEVDLVLTGHEHSYERLEKNNITYIISGGAGSWLNDLFPQYRLNESVYIEATFNFVYFDIYEKQFDARAFRPDYTLIDQYTINNGTKPDLRIENPPVKYTMLENETHVMNITVKNNGDTATEAGTQLELLSEMMSPVYFDVPILAPKESVEFTYTYSPAGPENRTFSLYIDRDENVDELIEENNEIHLVFEALPLEEPTPTDTAGCCTILAALSTIAVVAVVTMFRKKKKS